MSINKVRNKRLASSLRMSSFCIVLTVLIVLAQSANALLVPTYGFAVPATVTHHFEVPYVRHIFPRVYYPRTAVHNHVRSYHRETGHLSDTSVLYPFKAKKN
ncbi:hypothetical protein OESDEN_16394 [Oesophagostomum dentatum]|uniref:Uncharacterized protein n=1 Tax=Oesophagostomum dentatum TaxID=61180 RepID=A0A0B1SG36_OESDE|nr:hypothetical protein OESDEN_16394 [Oesophagostomum dentatum]